LNKLKNAKSALKDLKDNPVMLI